MKRIFFFIFIMNFLLAQYSRLDTIRGSNSVYRSWWDLNYYHLAVKMDITNKFLTGTNEIRYRVLEEKQILQIDLQYPMRISKIEQEGVLLDFKRDSNFYFVNLKKKQKKNELNAIKVTYSGATIVAPRAPWTGGFSFAKDKNGNDFVSTSCQGEGASLWWPCKDHMADEVDSMLISVTVPEHLMDVSNGRLRKVEQANGFKTFFWFVNNPINNYGVNLNIADYAHFSEIFKGEKGDLTCDYYVLKENLEAAKKQFLDAPKMLKAFEHWFGPYPFYEDGYKLVEAPYLGMEHQSSVTYGNKFANGYLGRDLSDSGWGLKFDFIIIHESGHEWFANNITDKDVADMWVHEGFTAYSENLFLDYYFGKQASTEYVIGTRLNIRNDAPIIGKYDMNMEGSGDMYYKGANILHTLRQICNDDTKWRDILRKLNKDFYHKTVTTKEVEDLISFELKMDLKPYFDQYLRDNKLPIFEYAYNNNKLSYRFSNCNPSFTMPLKVSINGKDQLLKPTNRWQKMDLKEYKNLIVDANFYVASINVLGK